MLRPDLSRPLTACDKGRFMRWSHASIHVHFVCTCIHVCVYILRTYKYVM